MKCSDCGKYDALNWSRQGFCLRCWLKSDESPAANEELHIVNDSDPLDVCPFCGGPLKPNPYGMCSKCRADRQAWSEDW